MSKDQSLEEMIRAAGQYVGPSDEHRASTLQRAMENGKDQTARKRFSGFTIAFALSMVLLSPMVYSLTRLKLPMRPSQDDIESAAAIEAWKAASDPSWSMVRLFSDMRQTQANPTRRLAK